MPELNREKHRERVRKAYLNNSFDSMSDSNALELLLFYSIPRKDVKEISYALLNHFGSLEAVFDADIKELMKVDGVGENTAILINLIRNLNRRVNKNKNNKIKKIDSSDAAMEFAKNELSNLTKERLIVINLDNNYRVIAVNTVSQGSSGSVNVDPYKVMECIFKDGAANVIIAHNHPNGGVKPSAQDLNFTLEIINICRKVNINVNDHIIVGEREVFSMANDINYSMYFDH